MVNWTTIHDIVWKSDGPTVSYVGPPAMKRGGFKQVVVTGSHVHEQRREEGDGNY
jgi:hypothetical protein